MLLSNTSSGALGSYTIDGLGNTSLSYPINGTYPFYNYKLMDATILDPNTAHNLEVVASEGQAFYIDYIILRSPTAFVTSSRSLAAGSNGSSSHKGAIAAGVVVGVLLSVGAVLIFLFLRRRRQTRRRDREGRLMGDDVLSSATEQLGVEGESDALEQGGSVETHTERSKCSITLNFPLAISCLLCTCVQDSAETNIDFFFSRSQPHDHSFHGRCTGPRNFSHPYD